MKRSLLLVATLALIAAACAGTTVEDAAGSSEGNVAQSTSSSSTSSSTAPSTDTSPTTDGSTSDDTTSSTVSESASKPVPEGPEAPDFTLALEPSGEFVLSQEVKPVFMVFWAEW